MEGHKMQQRKIDRIKQALVACSDSEPKYLVRGLQGKLRIGLAAQTVQHALAHAIALHRDGQ